MSERNASLDVERTVQQHGHGLRSLAAALIRHPADVDDVMQDVWLGVMRSPPDPRQGVGGWLVMALRNTVHKLHRGMARRRRRETLAAAPDDAAAESPLRLLEREEQARRLRSE